MKKKIIKRKTKISSPRKSASSPAKSALKPIGIVTHFYGKIKVAIIKFKKSVKTGTAIAIQGATTDFTQKIDSMQYDHQPIKLAKKGQEVGVKVNKKVHEGDQVFVELTG